MHLVKTKSFIKTANDLNMTQPGVSQHLKALEEYYNAQLVVRKGKQFLVTESGEKLRDYAQKLFRDEDQIRESIKADKPDEGICYLSSPGSIALIVHEVIISMHKLYPKLKFSLMVAPNETVLKGIEEEKFKMGFVAIEPESPIFKKTRLAQERLLLIAPRRTRAQTFGDLCNMGFVAHPDGYHYATQILGDNFPREFKNISEVPIGSFINQNNRILHAVENGLGFSVVPEYTYRHHRNKEALQIVGLKHPILLPVNLVTKKEGSLPKRYLLFLNELKKYLKNLPEITVSD